MYRLKTETELTSEMIKRYINKHTSEEARKKKLYQYYKGQHDILSRSFNDSSKPNNQIVNPYAQYITDIAVGYFLGEPVKYNSEETKFLDELSQIFNYNDEAAQNAELAVDASVMGEAYELVYLDMDTMVRFKRLDSEFGIPIYDDTVEEELLYFIRYYDLETDILTNKKTTFVEVYSRTDIRYYTLDLGVMTFVKKVPHQFGLVPIVIYANNREQMGDFETVIPLIDAYDKIESDSVNDMEYFADAYLMLVGMDGTDGEDIAKMKEQRVMLVPNGGSAQWLIKDINDGYVENLKNRLDASIHKFSKCPAMTDEEFASNASGVAMKYKLMGLENMTSKKERAFKKGLQRRIELICNVLGVMGTKYDYRAIDIVFTRNIPANLAEMADVVNKIGDLLSEKSKLDLLPIDIDYDANKAQKEDEKEAGYIDYGDELLGAARRSESRESGAFGEDVLTASETGV